MAEQPKATSQHETVNPAQDTDPAVTLLLALLKLRCYLAWHQSIRNLAEGRRGNQQKKQRAFDRKLKSLTRDADSKARAGLSRSKAYKERDAHEASRSEQLQPPESAQEPDHYLASLHNIVNGAKRYCQEVKTALSAGGTRDLDAVSGQNATTRTVALAVVLRQADSLLFGLQFGIDKPAVSPDMLLEMAESMQSIGESVGQFFDELSVVLAGKGMIEGDSNYLNDYFKTVSDRISEEGEWWPLGQFPKSMSGRIRMATGPNRKTKRVRTRDADGTKLYSVADVQQWWSQDLTKSIK